MKKAYVGLAALIAATGCGSVLVDQTGDATGTGGSTTGTGGSTTGTGGSSDGPCPPSPPTATSCAGPDYLMCTYGDSVEPRCRTMVTCLGGEWEHAGPCSVPPPAECGTSEPPAGSPCPNAGDECAYGDSFCVCACQSYSGPCELTWQCSEPPTTPGCPAVAPNSGTPCSAEGVKCLYGSCAAGEALAYCVDGYWMWQPYGC